MPLLPTKNSLDFNPDSTIMASKKIKSLALERMKNPTIDPDTATLSSLQAQKQLGDTFDKLDEMVGEYKNIVLRLGNLLSTKMEGGANLVDGARDVVSGLIQQARTRAPSVSSSSNSRISSTEFNRRRSAIADIIRQGGPASVASVSSSGSTTISPSEFNRRLNDDRTRFRNFYRDDDRNSTATPATPITVDEEDEDIDFEDSSTIPSRRSSSSGFPSYRGSEPEDPYIALGNERIDEKIGVSFNSLIFPLIQLTRKIDILITSRIRPAISSLTSVQIQKLVALFELVKSSYNFIMKPTGTKRLWEGIEEAVLEQNQFGDQIISTWNTERKDLMLNLTVVINSWKQNTPTGQQSSLNELTSKEFQDIGSRLGKKSELIDIINKGEPGNIEQLSAEVAQLEGSGRKRKGRAKKTGSTTLIGNGRNFYGERINDSRDVPCLLSSVRNCPTKYLL